jgi:hypothetical protein
MEFLRNKILIVLLFLSTLTFGQSITYSYIDPCTKQIKRMEIPSQNGNFPITVVYYNQIQNFTPQQLKNGEFDIWANSIYDQYGKNNPCSSVGFNIITNNILNVSNVIVTNVLSLNTLINTVSSFSSSVTSSVSSVTNTAGGKSIDNEKIEQKNEDNNSSGGGSGSGSSNNNSDANTKSKTDNKVEEKEVEQETNSNTGTSTNKTTSRASATQRQKPAILLTGDIVGVQQASDNSQDSRITTSYIRMKGDGKTSWGMSADFTIRAQVGNVSIFKSWITTKTQKKHIDVISNSVSLLPNTLTNTLVYIRIDNLKKFTWLYGAAGVYGTIYKEPMTAAVAIAGGMYRGKITKKIDAVAILATVYVPYMKYYTEQVFETKPIVIPFLNINYATTKTFRMGVTGGTTYSLTENILNYQILFGAKLTL